MNEHYATLIVGLPLFQGFTVQGAQLVLEGGDVKEHGPGEVLCREGDAADFVLMILSGKVQVFVERKGRTLDLFEAGPGTIVGELAVLCGIPRAASLRANEKLVVLHWSTEGFRRMLLRNASLSERILRQSLRMLIEKEQALINALYKAEDARAQER
jgi:CRP-like cAMP-binding protein